MSQPRVICIHCLYLAQLNRVLPIPDTAQLEERFDDNLKVASSSPLCTIFVFQQSSLVGMYVFTVGDPQPE